MDRTTRLADLLRDRCMYRPGARTPDGDDSPSTDIPLAYEPRSWAMSHSGRRIAVGTKAGQVLVATFVGDRWTHRELDPAPPDPRGTGRHAVRGVAFVDDDHLLVGRGRGRLDLWEVGDTTATTVATARPAQSIAYGQVTTGAEPLARFTLQRIRTLIPLVAGPSAQQQAALAVLIRLDNTVELVTRHGPTLTSIPLTGTPAVVDGDTGYDKAGQVVGTMLMTADGIVYATSGSPMGSTWTELYQVDLPHGQPARRIRTGPWGMVLTTEASVTMVPWPPHPGRITPAWHPLEGIKDVTGWDPGPSTRHMWLTASVSSRDGLAWWRWDRNPARPSQRRPSIDRRELNMRDVLGVLACSTGVGTPPAYVAALTRDHVLRIRHLANRTDVEEQLKAAPPPGAPSAGTRTPGLTLWSARQSIDHDLGGPPAAPGWLLADERPWVLPSWRLQLDGNDLRVLMSALIAAAGRATTLTPATFLKAFRKWALRLFRRASELRGVEQGIGADLQLQLERGLEPTLATPDVWQPGWAPNDRQDVSLRLRQLIRHLRKWVTFGHTYTEKPDRLIDLIHWNDACGRDLDALVYLLKLMRRRVDRQWHSRLPKPHPNAFVYAAASAAGLSVHAHADGRLTACDLSNGRSLSWSIDSGVPYLQTATNGHALEREGADRFRDAYFSGAYARALCLIDAGDGGWCLVVPLRATRPDWRQIQNDVSADAASFPLLLALRLTLQGDTVHVHHARSLFTVHDADEVYACELIHAPRAGVAVIAVGTKGVESYVRVEAPTPEVPVLNGATENETSTLIRAEPPKPEPAAVRLLLLPLTGDRPHRWEPVHRFPSAIQHRSTGFGAEIQNNPVWAITALTDGELWAGQEDGRIHRVIHMNGVWCVSPPADVDAWMHDVGEPISALLTWSVNGATWLVWGTHRGSVGMARHDGAGPWWRIALHGNRSKVRSLLRVRLTDPSKGGPPTMIDGVAAFFADGAVAIYDAGLGSRQGHDRIWTAGMRRDRFSLGARVNGAVALPWTAPDADNPVWTGEHPAPPDDANADWLILRADGQVERTRLMLPSRGQERHDAWEHCRTAFNQERVTSAMNGHIPSAVPTRECSSDVFGFAGAVGASWVWRWLRVLDDAGPEMVNYSLHMELRSLGPPLLDALQHPQALPLTDHVEGYIERLRSLAEESYRHRPWSREPVKVLWTIAAHVANTIAADATRPGLSDSRRQRCLTAYLQLNRAIDALSNQWIAAESDSEGAVLMHSFTQLIDWCDVVILSTPLGDVEASEAQLDVRRHLLRSLLQTRLLHRDPVVVTESLRAVNVAMIRALHHLRGPGREHLRPRARGKRPNWMDVQTLIGELPGRHGLAMSVMSPLSFEVARFFAGCLLLCPDDALGVGMVLSEAGLAEGRDGAIGDIAEEALRQVDVLRAGLGVEPPGDGPDQPPDPQRDAMNYLSDEGQRRLIAQLDWRVALAPTAGRLAYYSRDDMRAEIALVRDAMAQLGNLGIEGDEAEPPLDAVKRLTDMWSIIGVDPAERHRRSTADWCRYFSHTRALFKELAQARSSIRAAAGADPRSTDNIPAIIRTVRHDIRHSRDLFAPFRSMYLGIVDRWEDQTGKLYAYVRTLDRYNRHRYQVAASDAAAAMMHLVMTETAPDRRRWSTQEGAARVLLRDELKDLPAMKWALDRVLRLVDEARISSVLARTVVRQIQEQDQRDRSLSLHQTPLTEVSALLKQIAEELRVPKTGGTTDLPKMKAPGPPFVWAGILYELVRNIIDHHGGPNHPDSVNLWALKHTPLHGLLLSGGNKRTAENGEAAIDAMKRANADAPRVGGGGFGLAMVHRLAEAIGVLVVPVHHQQDDGLAALFQRLPPGHSTSLAERSAKLPPWQPEDEATISVALIWEVRP